MIWKEAGEKYIGQWNNNIQNGMGMHIWYETQNQAKYLRNRYVGTWKDGSREGYGIFFYSNGAKYEGFWKNNNKYGHGEYTFIDGTSYSGSFLDNRMAEFNEHGLYPLEASQNDKDHSRESSLTGVKNVVKLSQAKLKPIKVIEINIIIFIYILVGRSRIKFS